MSSETDPQIDIAHVARLARLDLDAEQMEHYGAQLQDIVAYAADVGQVRTEGLAEMSHPMGMENSFREDEVASSLDRERVLENAPATEDGYFMVPPSLGEDDADGGGAG